MRIVNALIALTLLALAFLQANAVADVLWVAVYGAGALLALLAVKLDLPVALVRGLAVLSVLAMLGFFAAFFLTVPYNDPSWLADGGLVDVGLLLAGFAMMPVLAEFTCRMKSGACGREHQFRKGLGRATVVSAPVDAAPDGSSA